MPTDFADAVGQTPGAVPVGHSQAWMPSGSPLPTSNPGRQNASAYSKHGPVSLLGHAQLLQHERECQVSSEAAMSSIKRDSTSDLRSAIWLASLV
jgi:hypothetical protein